MIKLGKESKLGLGALVIGGLTVGFGAMLFKRGRQLDEARELANMAFGEADPEFDPNEEIVFEEVVAPEDRYVEEMETALPEEEVNNETVYNPKADHKAMTQEELESLGGLATF